MITTMPDNLKSRNIAETSDIFRTPGAKGRGGMAVTPWSHGQEAFGDALSNLVAFDGMVLGVIDPRAPRCDALLASRGSDTSTLVQWCDTGFRKDELLREARRKGFALGQSSKTPEGPPLPAEMHLMIHLLPVSLSEGRAWYLGLGRSGSAFDEREQQMVALALRSLSAAFDHVAEGGMGRLLLGEDGRLIHADPATEALVLDEPRYIEELAATLPPMVDQRWPDLSDRGVHDVALVLADRPQWLRFQRARAGGEGGRNMEHWHWYVELRPLEADDIPPVGVIEDQRVARAVAYLSDRYAEAPSLNEVAEAVETSPFHFHRLFVRHVGRSPKHYLLRMQLMIAKWLLRATRTPIGEIAKATGFASHGHFTATFHRMVGQSPSQYRETA